MTFDYVSQPKETVKACNLCGRSEFDLIPKSDRYGLEVTVARCHSCGLRFLSPRMTAHAYREFYEDGHYRALLSDFYGRPITAESIEEEQTEYAHSLVNLLSLYLEGMAVETLLDVGGSTGVVAEIVANWFDLDATVLEPSEDEAQRAEGRGLNVIRGTIEDLGPMCDKFDVILLCQTVDHLTDIAGSLKTMRAMLMDGGIFYVDVVTNGPVKIDHPYDLDECAMLFFLARAGFEIVHSSDSGDGVHRRFVCRGSDRRWH